VTEDDSRSNSYDDDEDDSARDDYSAPARHFSTGYTYASPRYASRRSSGQYRREQRHSYTYAPSYTPNYIYYTPASLSEHASSPTSFDSEATAFDDGLLEDKEKEGWTSKLRRRKGDRGKEREDSQGDTTKEPKQEQSTPSSTVDKDEHVPTCNEAFQEHWQILKLRFNLSMFRTQRRLKHYVHSLASSSRRSHR
jgi:hypothetical protein